ncbi:MAG: glutathione metabolism protein [Xanthomonadales bacterium]|nr:glutathione metabolism protein [Xanthomonadales bacterium]NIX12582.1 glutathione metabolism protein [Xanthomonadales bacterium]
MEFPVTTIYAAFLGLLLVYLSDQVSRHRKRLGVSLGDGAQEALQRAVRAQGNFVEYTPFGLLLLLLLETEVTDLWLLHLLGVMLLLGRVLHAYGMARPDAALNGRYWGTALTWLMIVGTSLANLWHLI